MKTKEKKVMVGFPPSRETQLSWNNYQSSNETLAWTHANVGAIFPVKQIPRGGDVFNWNEKIDKTLFDSAIGKHGDQEKPAKECWEDINVDAVVIAKGNNIIFEEYFNEMTRYKQHLWYSMSKSFVSTIFSIFNKKGEINMDDKVIKYITEMKDSDSGFERTNILNILNHSSAFNVKENYDSPEAPFVKYYAPTANMVLLSKGEYWPDVKSIEMLGVNDFHLKFIKEDPNLIPGEKFEYASPNSDILGWILSKVSNKSLEELASDLIWKNIGAENDAFYWCDRALMPIATGGINTTARDALKFAKIFVDEGMNWKGKQIVPKKWIEEITNMDQQSEDAFDSEYWKKERQTIWTGYKYMWWLKNAKEGEFAALGVYGQMIYINQKNKTVAVIFSSYLKKAANNDSTETKMAFNSIIDLVRTL